MQSRLIASLLAAPLLAAGLMCAPARADDSEARLNALERQIRALQGELQHVRRDMAAHNEQVRALAKQSALAEARISHGGVETAAGVPPIPPGYALVPIRNGSTPGGVALARIEPEAPPEPKLPMGAFRVGGVTVTLGGFIEATGIY